MSKPNDSQDKNIDGSFIRIELTNGNAVTGQVNLKRGDGYDRASDLITDNFERFLVLFSVTVHSKDSDTPIKLKTMLVNKDHIVTATPE